MSKWKTKVLSIAIGLSVLAPTASFAADTATKDVTVKEGIALHQRFDAEQRQAAQDKILDMVDKYAPESLDEWENALAEKEQLMSELKEKATAQRPQLSEEAKEQIKAIREDIENGTITPEQAKEEFKNLGFGELRQHMNMTQLSEEAKEQIKAVREDIENGTITPEQAKEEFKNLGLQGKKDFTNSNNPMIQLKQAVTDGDESTIKELLPQLLEQLQEKNQQLSDRLSEIN